MSSSLSTWLSRRWLIVITALIMTLLMASARSRASGGLLVTPINPPSGQVATVANYPPAAIPYFRWAPVADATSYQLQVSRDIGFTQIAIDISTANTWYLPAGAGSLGDGTWYWRVRASGPSGWGDWPFTPWSFSRNWASNNAPSLVSPDQSATIEFFEDPVFSWTSVTGASYYVLRVGTDAACQTQLLLSQETIETRFNPVNRLPNGNYYWCVMPKDAAGRDGQLSAIRTVFVNYQRTTTLLEPANNSFPVYTPQFKWTAVRGATTYHLYYSTDSTFQTNVSVIQVDQTTYMFPGSLPNDKDYYWKVRVVYGGGVEGPDSEVWKFQKRWYHKPIILSPRNNEAVNVQSYTWTPVREAYYYVIEASFDPGFGAIKWSASTPNTWYWRNQFPSDEWGTTLYLRVRPYDGAGNPGKDSNPISYRPRVTPALVENLYPRYYYVPPSVPSGNYASPYNIPTSFDYALDIPTLYWSRTYMPGPKAGSPASMPEHVEADYYKVEVSSDVNFFTVNWTYTTQNLSATPDETTPFTPTSAITYYWRVTPYISSGAVLTNAATNQPWAVRFDTSRLITPTATSAPVLLAPPFNEKAMDTLPSFEWLPLQGAARYELDISTDSNFGVTTYMTRTAYTHHTPVVRLPKGTYFWRVRGLNGAGSQVGEWSTVRRLILPYQTRWVVSWPVCTVNTVPNTPNTLIGTSPASGKPEDLTTLYAAQDKDYWYIGFNVSPGVTGTVVYGLYLDGNQTDDSGAAFAPPNRPSITTVNYYRPEYAVYVTYSNTQFLTATAKAVALYRWAAIDGAWDPEIKDLLDPLQVGGGFTYNPATRYAEFKLPKTAIGDAGFDPYVLSPALFSATSNTDAVAADTVPDNGQNVSVFTEVKSISDRLSLSLPSDNSTGNGAAVQSMPFIYAEAGNIDWLRGTKLQIARDPVFNNLASEDTFTCDGCENYVDVFQHIFTPIKMLEDNTLYWRYIVRHISMGTPSTPSCPGGEYFSPPSEAHVFVKYGPVPRNLQIIDNYSSPTFRWDDIEGASNYDLQWSTNPDFSSNVTGISTNHAQYTHVSPIAPGRYYWRVRQKNPFNSSYVSDWSPTYTLAITLPRINLISPASGSIVGAMPTFKWQAVLTPTVQPTWGAPYYHLQVATSPNGFSSPLYDSVLDTVTWTPQGGHADGTYYWRVAVRDTSGYDGPYSAVYTFTKQYPVVDLLSPLNGSAVGEYPDFTWSVVDGATAYRLQWATDPQFTVNISTVDTHNTRYISPNKFNVNRYYWRVAIIDRNGFIGPFTDATIIVDPYPYRVFLPYIKK